MNRGDQASVHERFRSLRSGEVVGRPLVTAWLHLGTAHLPPDLVADLHLRFQRAFGWDIVKVMHDYRYALPVGLDDAPGRDFFAAVAEAGEPHGLAGQRDVLRHLLAARDRAVPVVETVFSPFQTRHRSAGSRVVPLLKEHPEEAAGALEVICDRMVDHVRTCLDMGVDGIFLSVNGA
ncbi:MAG TPA: hypothetical protein VGD43_20575, partial [Micromonospora sp.]